MISKFIGLYLKFKDFNVDKIIILAGQAFCLCFNELNGKLFHQMILTNITIGQGFNTLYENLKVCAIYIFFLNPKLIKIFYRNM